MKQAYSNNPELISEQQMLLTTSECYILLEKYKLKTNLVGINMPKDLIEDNYSFLEERMTDRYQKMYQKLKEGLNKLHINFMIAQGNSLRTLNNIFRNYRRRVGTLSNQPLSSLKYNKYDRQEKLILQSIIYNERDNFNELLSFKQEIEKNLENGKKEIEEKYRQNEKIKENYKVIFDVIDKTQCYTFKYYDHFERSMHTTINNLQTNFDKLNAFLSVWQNVGSTKAYELKSLKQIQSEEKSHENDRNRRYYQQETEEQLEELMKNCPQHSPQRQQYRKRLNQLRRYNSQKQKKLDMVGKMYSKRRNRAGILVNKNKQISVLQWVINLDNSKIPYNYHDEFKSYRADNEHTDYRLTPYESQKPMKSAEDIKDHLEKYRSTPILNFQWWYDRFGKEGNVDLISSWSQQIQKRIEFEVVRQTQLQNSDDRRKRELLQKQNYQMKQNERRQCLHIGYLHAHDKTELQSLMERSYNTQYIPELVGNQDFSDISFTQEEDNHDDEPVQQPQKPVNLITKASLLKNKEEFPFVKIEDIKDHHISTKKEEPLAKEKFEPIVPQKVDEADMSLEEQIIKIYFKQYSKKIIRKQSQPQYRKTQFLYFRSVSQIKWSTLASYLDYQKIFIYTQKSILYFNKIFSASQQKMKCNIYTVQEEDEEAEEERQLAFKENIRTCFKNSSLVTIKFHPIYLDNENLTAFMIGLLVVLMRQGKMLEDYELKDFVNEGKEIVEDFNEYFFPEDNRSTKSIFMRKFKPHVSQDVFAPTKKSDKNNEAESIKSTTESTLKTESYVALKETKKQVHQPISHTKQAASEQSPATKQEKAKPPLTQIKEESNVLDQYSRLHQQRQLKRSNSRQFINNYQMQIELNKLQQEYPAEGKDSNDADYEQL